MVVWCSISVNDNKVIAFEIRDEAAAGCTTSDDPSTTNVSADLILCSALNIVP